MLDHHLLCPFRPASGGAGPCTHLLQHATSDPTATRHVAWMGLRWTLGAVEPAPRRENRQVRPRQVLATLGYRGTWPTGASPRPRRPPGRGADRDPPGCSAPTTR